MHAMIYAAYGKYLHVSDSNDLCSRVDKRITDALAIPVKRK